MQYYGLTYFYQVAAPAGTFVNKNFATPLLPLLIPFLAYQIATTENRKQYIFYSAVFVLSIIYLIIAVTRSSWLSCSIVLLILIIYTVLSKIRTKILLRFLPIFIVVAIFFILDINIHKSSSMQRDYRKIETIIQRDKPIQQRFDKWQNGLAMFTKHPLLGYGAGNFDANYPLFHEAKVVDSGYSAKYFLGGVHNIFLQILLETGLIGFVLILIFWLRLLVLTISNYRKSSKQVILVLLLGLFGFLIDCFWNNTYQHPTYAIIISLFALYLIKDNETKQKLIFSIPKNVLVAFHVLFFIVTIIVCHQFAGSEIYMKKALLAESKQNHNSAWNNVNTAISKWKWRSQNHYIASRIGYTYFASKPNKSNWMLVNELNTKTLKTLPYHYMPNLITLLLEMQKPNPDFSKKNIDLFLTVSPASKKGESYEMLATVYERNRDWASALDFYQKALECKPENKIEKKIEMLKKMMD
jgi:tetratricopeptide (TPR) repeat protein